MFKEKTILKKILLLGIVLLLLFLGFFITWEIRVGNENRKYMLDGMKHDDEFSGYYVEGDMGEYYRMYDVPFPEFDLNGLQLYVACGEGDAFKKYFSGNGWVKGYPNLEVYSATFDIFPNRKLEDGRYMVFLTVWDHSTDERSMASMCVDAQGNYYLPPGVMRDEETQNLARAYLDSEWKEYLIRMAKEAWGEDLFKEE